VIHRLKAKIGILYSKTSPPSSEHFGGKGETMKLAE
jgi:hypothetical protein